jgi:hypothetical protein
MFQAPISFSVPDEDKMASELINEWQISFRAF